MKTLARMTLSQRYSLLMLTALPMLAYAQILPQKPVAELAFFDGETPLNSSDAWSLDGEELVCTGKPRGYLVIADDVADFTLSLEWKWDNAEGGNSGVLIHALPGTSGFRTWASSIEVQLQKEMAGDIYAIGQLPGFVGEGSIFVAPGVPVVRLDRQATNEKPVGEWNQMEIICHGDEVTILVNGETVNAIKQVKPNRGAIALQSEGAPIRFRNIKLELQ